MIKIFEHFKNSEEYPQRIVGKYINGNQTALYIYRGLIKRQKISFTIDPRVYEIWKKYCEDNNIENQSEFVEKLIIKKTSQNKQMRDKIYTLNKIKR